MNRNWGQNWHINTNMKNQPLSFEITSSDGVTLTSYNVAPKNWDYGQSFEGKQYESWSNTAKLVFTFQTLFKWGLGLMISWCMIWLTFSFWCMIWPTFYFPLFILRTELSWNYMLEGFWCHGVYSDQCYVKIEYEQSILAVSKWISYVFLVACFSKFWQILPDPQSISWICFLRCYTICSELGYIYIYIKLWIWYNWSLKKL